jgi:phage/conjugal plasmid C-4 type zinc finger TraR family protein
MPDEMDLVQEQNAERNADALREHWLKQKIGQGLSHCEACGEEIPEARRRAKPDCRTCINCQTEIEFDARRLA